MNVINDMLRIKDFRLNKAELEVSLAREKLEEADHALRAARTALKDCRIKNDKHERALYADLCSRAVRLADLDDVKLEVDLMRAEAQRLEEAQHAAEEKRKQATERLAQARSNYQDATRAREKFSELQNIADEEDAAELTRAEEMELEEVASRPVRVIAVEMAESGNDAAIELAA